MAALREALAAELRVHEASLSARVAKLSALARARDYAGVAATARGEVRAAAEAIRADTDGMVARACAAAAYEDSDGFVRRCMHENLGAVLDGLERQAGEILAAARLLLLQPAPEPEEREGDEHGAGCHGL